MAMGILATVSCSVSAADRTLDDAVYSKAQARYHDGKKRLRLSELASITIPEGE